jgi:MFS family permease
LNYIDYLKEKKHISRRVILLGITSFLNDVGSEMILPILPMFIASLGGGGLVIGLIGGLRDSISSVLKVVTGYWSDKLGTRKPFVYFGYFISSLFKLLLAFSTAWEHVLMFSCLERVGKGMRTATRDAIVAEAMPENRGRGFGIHRTFDTIGGILGSILVFLFLWLFGFSFKTIILIAAVFSFLTLFPLYFVHEKKHEANHLSFKLGMEGLSKEARVFIAVAGVFALANFSYMFFILKAGTLYTGKWAVIMPVLLYILFNIFYAVFSIPSGKMADRIGHKKMIMMGYALFGVVSLGFLIFHSTVIYFVLFALYGIVYAIIEVNQRAYIANLSQENYRGTALGTFHTVVGVMTLPASLIAGILWQIHPELTFVYGFLTSVFAAFLLAV